MADEERLKQVEGTAPTEKSLPILAYRKEIEAAIASFDVVIVVGETGSGKTTKVYSMITAVTGPDSKVAITQPRRVAARSVARFVAAEEKCPVGEDVGYQVRFEDHTTEGTRVNFMTDGILLRKIQADPLLREYDAVMVDEAHERSLNIDFILGLLKRIQAERAEGGLAPLKIVIASATLEKEKFVQFFDGAKLVEVPGRLYPVEVHYQEEPVRDYIKAAAEVVEKIVKSGDEGDILVFMPGQAEIYKEIGEIKERDLPVTSLPLYGDMSPEDQDRIFERGGLRKVTVATNMAETSITISGVRYVIDPGLLKQTEFDHRTGITSLVTVGHAKSGCDQRTGRAGRTAPGVCYRLYTKDQYEKKQTFQTPEIQRSDLSHVVLMMKQIGIKDVESFDFIDPPDPEALEHAVRSLQALGALDEQERMTAIGETMAELPLEPRLARMIIEADEYQCVETISTIVSFIGLRNVFIRPEDRKLEADDAHHQFRVRESDFLTILRVWQEYERRNFDEKWARDNFLNTRVLNEARNVRYQLFQVLHRNGIRVSESTDTDILGRCIAAGLIENLMQHQSRHAYQKVSDLGSDRYRYTSEPQYYYIHPSSAAFGYIEHDLLVAGGIVETTKAYARWVQVVKSEWLPQIAPQLIEEVPGALIYDSANGVVVRRVELSFKGQRHSFAEISRREASEEAVGIFLEALANDRLDLPIIRQNRQVIQRLTDLWVTSAGTVGKYFDQREIMAWYRQKIGLVSSVKDLEEAIRFGLDLRLSLDSFVSEKQLAEVRAANPDTIRIEGRVYPIDYAYDKYNGSFPCSIRMAPADVLKVDELPKLPSGRIVRIEVFEQLGISTTRVFGQTLAELKQGARDLLNQRQFDRWTKENPGQAHRPLGDSLSSLPSDLPPPVRYGDDVVTGEPLVAYSAVVIEKTWSGRPSYIVEYFPNAQRAQEEQVKAEAALAQEKAEQQRAIEARELAAPAQEAYTRARGQFDSLGYQYSQYGISEEERGDLGMLLAFAQGRLVSDPKGALELLSQVNERLAPALEVKIRAEEASLARTAEKIRIDEYRQTAALPLEELQTTVYEGRSRNIGRWRLAIAALAEKGIEGVEALLEERARVDGQVIDDVIKALNKASSEANSRGRYDLSSVDKAIRSIEVFRRVQAANNHRLVIDFIGLDKAAKADFRARFYQKMNSSVKLPDINSLGPQIEEVFEEMTS